MDGRDIGTIVFQMQNVSFLSAKLKLELKKIFRTIKTRN